MTVDNQASGASERDEWTERGARLFASEKRALLAATPRSRALFERARTTMPLGVASSFQAIDPYPIYLARGQGAEVVDVDGRRYIDFNNGLGAMAVGHAHPAIVAAIDRAARNGTHFAVTTERTVQLAEEICRRFKMERVRFGNSGTEATMDAIRLARGATGRRDICKIEGSYHGHHDAVMFSVTPSLMLIEKGEGERSQIPASKGIPAEMGEWTHVLRFNDLIAAEQMFVEFGESLACLIIEPVMMNIGIVLPKPGYLEGLRDLCDRYGVVLIFDEVKCGATIAAGGATEKFGVQPDLICLAKSVFGGLPGSAFGGRADLMDQIGSGIAQQGTFNGNPLVTAAALAALTEVLIPDTYRLFAKLGTRMALGCRSAIIDNGLPAHVVDLGCKGCISYRRDLLVDYRSFLETNVELFDASWAWLVNRGIFMTPGNEEQWTISAQHEEADIDRFVEVFFDFCAAVAA